MRNFIIATTAAVIMAAPAAATVTSGTIDGGTALNGPAAGSFLIVPTVPGFSVGNDNFQDNNVRAFDEKQNVTLLSSLNANQGGTFAAGTRVSSHYLVFDPRFNRSAFGTVTFGKQILGVFTSRVSLLASDVLGAAGITYLSPPARGLEANTDSVSFLGNVLKYSFGASSPGDSVRIITASVPEPASWAMLIAGFGLVGASMRRRRMGEVSVLG